MPLSNPLDVSTSGTKMDLVDSPNATAQTSLRTGLGIGALTNTGAGAETLTAILGDVASVPMATSLAKIAAADSGGMIGNTVHRCQHAHVVRRALNFYERWFGLAATPSGETHRADRLADGILAFQIDAGNATWGSWVQILGSSDTPAVGSPAYYNLHKLMITAAERAATYFIQLGFGATAAEALTNGTYTEFVYKPNSTSADEIPYVVRARRQAAGTKAWARCLCIAQNTGTVDFYLGLIEYEG